MTPQRADFNNGRDTAAWLRNRIVEVIAEGKDDIDEEAEKLRDKLSKMIHRINQEKHGDMYYWFDKDNDEFLAQGKTADEIIDHVKSRFPKHIFIFNDDRALRGPDWKVVPIQELTQK
mgnify:CR=1 FL=1